MLALVFIYFVGKAFFDLAGDNNKSKWGFAIVGVISYYFGLFVGALIVGIIVAYISPDAINDSNSTAWGLTGIPIGLISCWLFYLILKRTWERSESPNINNELLDSDLRMEDSDRNDSTM